MGQDEREVWREAVRQANRYGREGKRVLDVTVICPTTATSNYVPFFLLDNGPRDATECW